ncbi:hypothetical protein Pcinc_031567, partial [Petrolisthes cinctipes]
MTKGERRGREGKLGAVVVGGKEDMKRRGEDKVRQEEGLQMDWRIDRRQETAGGRDGLGDGRRDGGQRREEKWQEEENTWKDDGRRGNYRHASRLNANRKIGRREQVNVKYRVAERDHVD